MLIWASLLVLAVCSFALGVAQLDGMMIEVVPLMFATALFVMICAIESRQ